ncbi:MAG: hypothetical protein ACFCVE_02125 [Phycisphaerae bacterium]
MSKYNRPSRPIAHSFSSTLRPVQAAGFAAAALLLGAGLSGCAGTKGSGPVAEGSAGVETQPAPPAQEGWPEADGPRRTADADIEELKRLADEYARQLEAVIAERQQREAAKTTAGPASPATQPAAEAGEPGQVAQPWPQVEIEEGRTTTNTAVAVGEPLEKPASAAASEPTPEGMVANAAPATQPVNPAGAPAGDPAEAIVSIEGDPFAFLVDESASAEEAVDLADQIAARIETDPNDIAAHLDWQLLQLARGQSVPDLKRLSQLPAEDRQIVSTIVDGLANLRRDVAADRNLLMSDKIQPVTDMAQRLLDQSVMTVPTIKLCRRVDGFAAYQPFDPARFRQGRTHDVIVYCELDNFTSSLSPESLWETKLTKQLVLYSENGVKVWSDERETVTDQTRKKRRDFFFAKMIRLPESLTTGRYTLKVTVVDENANQVAESSVGLEIVSE